MDDEDFMSSDDEVYVNVPMPSSDIPNSNEIPPLPLSTDNEEDADGSCQDYSRHAAEEVVDDEEDSYTNLSDSRNRRDDGYEDVHLMPDGHQEEVRVEEEREDEQDKAPIEIEMQLMRKKSPHSPEKDSRRKAFEFHMPLFLKNSSSVESSLSVSNERSRYSLTTHSEDSDSSADVLDKIPSIPSLPDSSHNKSINQRDSNASSDDSWSADSTRRVSMETSNPSTHSVPRDYRRIRGKRSEYDRPVSSVSTDYDRPVSSVSTEYDRPISSTSADYISVLNSFHEDGVKDDANNEGESS